MIGRVRRRIELAHRLRDGHDRQGLRKGSHRRTDRRERYYRRITKKVWRKIRPPIANRGPSR
jgi:hypothetical protein